MSVLGTLRAELSDALKKVANLPVSSRDDVRDDLEVLRELVLNQRHPRIAIVGKTDVSLGEVMATLGTSGLEVSVGEHLGRGRWYAHELELGTIEIADLRFDEEPNLKPLEYDAPDLVIAVARSEDVEVDEVAGALHDALERTDDVWGSYPAGLAIVYRAQDGRNAGDFKTMQAFKDAFVARDLPRDWVDVLAAARPGLGRTLLRALPMQTRFAMARLTQDLDAKRELAFELTRLAATLNAAVASVPIPVASAIPITTIQVAMISGIAMLSGRTLSTRTMGEFAAAIGLNVGAAVAFRELARALIQWIPVAGPLISASIAAGATFTLGKAAVRHYLDAPA